MNIGPESSWICKWIQNFIKVYPGSFLRGKHLGKQPTKTQHLKLGPLIWLWELFCLTIELIVQKMIA